MADEYNQDGSIPLSPSTDAPVTPEEGDENVVQREQPQPDPARQHLVSHWISEVKRWKEHWEKDFNRMRDDSDFAWGLQWSKDLSDDRYTANITLRHIQQRTASLYAKNPTPVARRRERLLNTVWDGQQMSLQTAQQTIQTLASPQTMEAMGAPGPMTDAAMVGAQTAMAIVADAEKTRAANDQLDKIAKTLELLYQYQIDEQIYPFKSMLKHTVRRTLTKGVGYVKLGFQRAMDQRPDLTGLINDISSELRRIEALSADIADNQVQPESKEVEELRLMLQALQAKQEVIVREGLVFDYPNSECIIPDTKCRRLRQFVGCDSVAEEYALTAQQIQEIYGVDVGAAATSYTRYQDDGQTKALRDQIANTDTGSEDRSVEEYLVWEIYCRRDGLVYVVCDGYNDFLREPSAPDVYLERFWPWFTLMVNEVDNDARVYPPSDVQLIKDQQQELNRMREALREHRIANRPAYVVAGGLLDETDKGNLANRAANVVLELNALQPNQKVEDVIQVLKHPGIDPNMYETQNVFEDIMRSVGASESALGTAGGGITATEATQAEQARGTSLASAIDELDDFLSELARSSSQVLLLNVSRKTVMDIIGIGAVWPELTRSEVAQELYLEIRAGSAGRPNQMMEIQNMERLLPFLIQMPGISPQWLTEEIIRRLDDQIDLQQAFLENMPSIIAQNALATARNGILAASAGGAEPPRGLPSPGGGSPSQGQGEAAQGATNAPAPPSAPSQAPGAPPGGVAARPF